MPRARSVANTCIIALTIPIFLSADKSERCRAFRRMSSFQRFASVHSSVHNQLNHQMNIESRARLKAPRDAALLEWCLLIAA